MKTRYFINKMDGKLPVHLGFNNLIELFNEKAYSILGSEYYSVLGMLPDFYSDWKGMAGCEATVELKRRLSPEEIESFSDEGVSLREFRYF